MSSIDQAPAAVPEAVLPGATLARYLASGGVGTLAHYLVFTALLLGLEPAQATTAYVVVASITGALVGAAVNYVLARHLVFASRAPHRHALPRFMSVAGASLALNALVISTAHRSGFDPLSAQLLATASTAFAGYLCNRHWTFAWR